MYQCGEAHRHDGPARTAEEYAADVIADNSAITGYLCGDAIPEESEADLAADLNDAAFHVQGGHGTLVAFRWRNGEISIESVDDRRDWPGAGP